MSLVRELFPSADRASSSSAALIDSSLDRLVLAMSGDLVDDFPASDPRWMESVPASESAQLAATPADGSASAATASSSSSGTVGATMSLLILHQLEDKQTALEFYINFLQEVGLWQQVNRGTACIKTEVMNGNSFFQLSGVTLREVKMPTSLALCEHVEKTTAAISLRQMHNE